MKATGVGIIVILLAATARADPPAEPRLAAGVAATVWVPLSDADDFADVSLGVRPQVTYAITPLVGVVGSFEWIFVNEESGVGDVTYYAIAAGARLTLPRPARIQPYGELLVGWHKLDATGLDDSGIGLRLGGGAIYALGQRAAATAGLSYSAVSIDAGFVDLSIAAFVLDIGIAARF